MLQSEGFPALSALIGAVVGVKKEVRVEAVFVRE